MISETKYNVIEIFTDEEAMHGKRPLYEAVVNAVRDMKVAGRCMVTKGTDACYENGEVSTRNILTLPFNLPVKIEIVLPSGELDRVLPAIDEMVEDGIVAFRELTIRSHKTHKHFIQRHIKVKDIMTRSPEIAMNDTPVSNVAKKAGDLMKKDIITVFENTLSDAVKIMVDKGLKRLPVIDSEGRFKGMISRDSLLRTGFQHA